MALPAEQSACITMQPHKPSWGLSSELPLRLDGPILATMHGIAGPFAAAAAAAAALHTQPLLCDVLSLLPPHCGAHSRPELACFLTRPLQLHSETGPQPLLLPGGQRGVHDPRRHGVRSRRVGLPRAAQGGAAEHAGVLRAPPALRTDPALCPGPARGPPRATEGAGRY